MMNLPIKKPRGATVQLRPYQNELKQNVFTAWGSGVQNVLAVMPTGAGKTVVISNIMQAHAGPSCALAHRQELVSQLSLALARNGVRHRVIGPAALVKTIVNLHMLELGRSFYAPNSSVAVAGVKTLKSRRKKLEAWARTVTLWIPDEAHHVLRGNEWGQAAEMFPNAKCLGVTATPMRADGKGLGRHADGIFDKLVEGPGLRWLINSRYLTDYRIYAPPPALLMNDAEDLSGSTGDYKRNAVVKRFRENKNKIIGDVVAQYQKHAAGKLGVTFVPDVEDAEETARAFNAAGVPAAAVSAETPDAERVAVLRRFRNRELLQLVNVELFGEGFDLPAIEVVSMARPTQSYGLFVQQFGRALRLLEGKTHAVIIDHVGNIFRHGLPDAPRGWTLDRRESRRSSGGDASREFRACVGCSRLIERFYKACPFCRHIPEPAGRQRPEQVDGDLTELDAATLAELRGEVERAQRTTAEIREEAAAKRMPHIGQLAAVKRQDERLQALAAVREAIAWWAGYQRAKGLSDAEGYRLFYLTFGLDVLTAQALKTKEAQALTEKLGVAIYQEELNRAGR